MVFSLFSISGLVHLLTSWQLSPGCRDYGDLQFFCVNAAAVCLEAAILQLISPRRASKDQRGVEPERSRPWGILGTILARFVGYVWVVGFFVWAFPKFYYGRVHCMINQQLELGKAMARSV